jgi:hypothetical protein
MLHPFLSKTSPFPPQKKPASVAKPLVACFYKILTLMLYDLVNHPNLMGAHRSCGQFEMLFLSWLTKRLFLSCDICLPGVLDMVGLAALMSSLELSLIMVKRPLQWLLLLMLLQFSH